MSISKLFKITIIFLAAGLFVTSTAHAALAFRNINEGQPVPGFTLKDMGGSDVSLSSYAGKVVIVAFIKPDQENSAEALRDLQKMNARLQAKGIAILAVMPEMDQQAGLKELVEKEKITFPVLLDDGRKVYGEWGAFLYPTTGIIDKEGKLAVQVPSHNRKYAETVEGNALLAAGEVTKEQLDAKLNPKEKEKLTPEQKEASRRMMLAQKLLERKMIDKAAAELEQAVQADPNLAEARVKYGFVLLKTGDPVKARENFTKAVEINPRAEDAKAGLGAALTAQGEVDKGIETLTEALKMNPRPARTHFELGRAYEKKGAPDKAAEHYRKALEELSPDW